jgi:hypothetical protein
MKSSSESILVLVLVLVVVDARGVGGFESLAEANLLLFRVAFEEDSMASAFLFFGWEEMMSR